MAKYEVDFKDEPMLYFGVGVNKEVGLSEEGFKGFERGEQVYLSKTGILSIETGRLFYKEEWDSNQLDEVGEEVEYRVELSLGDLFLLVGEVIGVDTGVDIEEKVEIRTDFYTDRSSIKLYEDDFSKEEFERLKGYRLEDNYENMSKVINNYFKYLGYGDGKLEVEVYCESVEDERLYVYTVKAK